MNYFQAFNVVLLSLLAMLPSPIVYGAIIDNTCILWQESCDGGTGNCLLYDTEKLRMTLMLTTGEFFYNCKWATFCTYLKELIVVVIPEITRIHSKHTYFHRIHHDCWRNF